MRTRTTLILLAANLLLFGAIFYLHHQGHPGRIAREQSSRIFGPEVNSLDYLELRLPDQEPRVLRKQPEADRWEIRSPVQWPANFFAVSRILQQLKFLERKTSFRTDDLERTGQTLADYGLEDPPVVLIFGRGSKRYEVRIGKPTDIGDRLYILDPDEEWIHVVGQDFAQSLSLNLDQLQSDSVFEIPLFEVRSLNLQLGTHSRIRLARDDSNWFFETPFQTRADRKSVEALINRLNGLQIDQFIRTESEDFGFSNPSMRITLDGNAKRETLLVGNPLPSTNGKSRVFAKLADNPTVFALPAEPLQALENAQTLLRDRKLVAFDPNRVTSVRIASTSASEVVLQKLENAKWQIVSRYPDQSVRILPADTKLVDRLLQTLDETHVLQFKNDAPSDDDLARYGFNQPQRLISLGGDGDFQLLLGAHVPDANGSAIFAKLSTSRFVYTVDASLLRELPANTDYFRDRLLLPQPDGAVITSIQIRERASGNVLFNAELPTPATSWETAVAEFSEKEAAAVLSLLSEIRHLRVNRYIRDEFSSTVEIN
ncbi:MAG TPA: DUF4340 domain-containing protein, partial [Opitutales bacterium]|nr:DUF4340 domain-containing protein [Opitutales bacterium]